VLNTQTANYVFAGPTSGSAAIPTFRALVSADIPNNAANTTGSAATAATENMGTNSTAIATTAQVQSSVAVITSNFTEGTGTMHTVMTIPSSGNIATGAAFAGRCSGAYQFSTAEKIELELNASQTVQNGSIDVYIAYNNTTSSDPFLVDQSYTTALVSANQAAAPAVPYAWHIDFGGTWNATTAGTIALQATTSSSSGTLTILAGARCVIF
jgi:hypothetical protein